MINSSNLPNKDFLRTDEVSKLFNVSRGTVYNWIGQNKIRSIRISGTIRIPKSTILKIISTRQS